MVIAQAVTTMQPQPAGPDLLFQTKWKTLGQGVHFQYHDAVGNYGTFHPPDLRSTSAIAPGGSHTSEYPAPSWVDAIDKAHGRADWQLGEFTRLSPALEWLQVFDNNAKNALVSLCIQGRAQVMFGRGVKHHALAEVAAWPIFDDSDRKVHQWLTKSWELVAILLATPDTLRRAVEANCVALWALEWCRDRGLIDTPPTLRRVR